MKDANDLAREYAHQENTAAPNRQQMPSAGNLLIYDREKKVIQVFEDVRVRSVDDGVLVLEYDVSEDLIFFRLDTGWVAHYERNRG